ncbi:MAG: hypothetical protein M5R36_12675 [Deltaproteobacteria bacterium]|nr:hypothetical protein [Deltaproteobacteria bacterium]
MESSIVSTFSFRMHHEAVAPFCAMLVWPCLGLAALTAGAARLGRAEVVGARSGTPGAFAALALLLVGCSLLTQNDFFYALYDPKGFPVHPPEVVAQPHGAYVHPIAHLFTTVCLMGASGLAAWALRRKKSA